ncbi:hypothetical protein ACR6HW_08970 [Fusibacter sp. JL298sf-3]
MTSRKLLPAIACAAAVAIAFLYRPALGLVIIFIALFACTLCERLKR